MYNRRQAATAGNRLIAASVTILQIERYIYTEEKPGRKQIYT